ncbi:olfactory receptor 1F1-like [Leptodactylus fuscus]|uniref:olfactory receptor 1F1-like n=1 Tax=Leptodactylus fuscus TaxID=238119 RepID=UPI003F4F33AC
MVTNSKNNTLNDEFYILAFPTNKLFWLVLFIAFLLLFLMAILGNLLITLLIWLTPCLHTPMYFFLCNLSIQDIIHVSATLPKLLAITLTDNHYISFVGCLTQLFMFALCVDTDFFLLTSMAYDRYVAICVPLQYSRIMNFKICLILAAMSWTVSGWNALMYTFLMSHLSFCHACEINHFFCDMKAMLKVSKGDSAHIKIILYVECVLFGFMPFLLILTSYVHIIFIILKIRTRAGRMKTFSSCSSHIITVLLFCGSSLSQYMKPESINYEEQDKILSLLYIAVVPMLNPLVYSLRNKEVLKILRKIVKLQ